MPIVFILLAGVIVLGFFVVAGIAVLAMRERTPNEESLSEHDADGAP